MSDYSIAIKIAGELANSFKSSLQGAQKGLSGLASMAGKIGGATMKAAATGIGAAATAAVGLGTAAIATGKEFESAMQQNCWTLQPKKDRHSSRHWKMLQGNVARPRHLVRPKLHRL